MGLEMSYQAIPEGCGLLDVVREDAAIGESLSRLPLWFRRPDGGPAPGREGEKDDPLWDWCCRQVAEHPDLRIRNCSLDRRWDQLHYLLSATRRSGPAAPADLAIDRAFGAGELIADHARASQGEPVRYLPPAAVRAIAELIEPMDRDALLAHYDPARMEAAAVYKSFVDQAHETERRWIVESFEAFRRFFLAAAGAGDGVIVCLD